MTFATVLDTRFEKFVSAAWIVAAPLLRSKRTSANGPTTYYSSSIDPWHSAADADVNATGSYQHTGFDLFFTSGLTNNLPAMIPVTMLYGTPDDAAAQIAYIEKRGYPISYIEMGEEPDGKHAMPEDYAALYLQWATAIHKVDPKLKLGGPDFRGRQRRYPGVARRSGTNIVDGPICGLSENARSTRPISPLSRLSTIRSNRATSRGRVSTRNPPHEAHSPGLAR